MAFPTLLLGDLTPTITTDPDLMCQPYCSSYAYATEEKLNCIVFWPILGNSTEFAVLSGLKTRFYDGNCARRNTDQKVDLYQGQRDLTRLRKIRFLIYSSLLRCSHFGGDEP